MTVNFRIEDQTEIGLYVMIFNLRWRVFPILFFSPIVLFGQTEGTMPFMSSLPQVTYYNPAFKPKYNFSFGLRVHRLRSIF